MPLLNVPPRVQYSAANGVAPSSIYAALLGAETSQLKVGAVFPPLGGCKTCSPSVLAALQLLYIPCFLHGPTVCTSSVLAAQVYSERQIVCRDQLLTLCFC